MSVTVAEGVVEVTADAGSAVRSIGSQLEGGSATIGRSGSVLGGVFGGSFLGNIASNVVIKAAGIAGEVIGGSIAAGVNYAVGSVDLASNLTETRSAIQQVFGPVASATIEKFAKSANRNLGQTQQSALSAAQTFGVFGRAAGLTDAPLAEFSTNLVKLSGDMASFYNADPSEVIEALGAGLRGESEPLRRFGVLLDDATLKARAMTMGIYDGTGSLTQQQRVLAAQAEIFAQTGIAQGDFMRTSDGLANQQRILSATLEDTQAKLGEYLLPSFNRLATFANDTLLPRLGSVIDKIGPKLGDALDRAAPKVEALLDKVAPLAEGFADWAGDEGIPRVIELMDKMADAAPGWANALDVLTDPDNPLDNFVNGLNEWIDSWNGENGLLGDVINDTAEFLGLPEPFHNAGESAAIAYAEGVATADAWDRVYNTIKTGINDPLEESAVKAGISAQHGASYLITGWQKGGPGAIAAASAIKTGILAEFASGNSQMPGLGALGGQGFADGLRTKRGLVGTEGAALAAAAVAAVKKGLKIASPSRVTHELGGFTGIGFAEGIRDEIPGAQRAMADLINVGAGAGAPGASLDISTSPSAMRASQPMEGSTVVTIGSITLEARTIKEFDDVLDMIRALPQVARAGRPQIAGGL